MSTFDVQVPADHTLAPEHVPYRRYPRPTYSERQQLISAVNRELYSGAGSPKPRNFSSPRWASALRMVRNRMTDF